MGLACGARSIGSAGGSGRAVAARVRSHTGLVVSGARCMAASGVQPTPRPTANAGRATAQRPTPSRWLTGTCGLIGDGFRRGWLRGWPQPSARPPAPARSQPAESFEVLLGSCRTASGRWLRRTAGTPALPQPMPSAAGRLPAEVLDSRRDARRHLSVSAVIDRQLITKIDGQCPVPGV